MRRILAVLLLAAAVLAGAARPSHAAITFEYDNVCTAGCSHIGLSSGDAVSGTISFNDAAVVLNATLSSADVVGFALDFGTVDITFASAAAFVFVGTLNATASAFTAFALQTSEAVSPATGDYINIQTFSFIAGPDGACFGDCSRGGFLMSVGEGLEAGLVLQEVPEPASLVLLGTALAALALARRRRKTA